MSQTYAQHMRETLDAAMAQFEEQFVAHSAYQSQQYWSLMLGNLMVDLRAATAEFTEESVTDEGVVVALGLAATMAACADFIKARFVKDKIDGVSDSLDG